jgi:tetratricopeptide (TPR) repeat protein
VGGLPHPDVPPGPRRDLADALHEVHHRAGWPSLRALAQEAGCSHTTVSAVFSSPKLPSWGVLELLVEAMGGDVPDFRDLWLVASAPSDAPTPGAPRIAGRKEELTAVRRHLETGSGLLLVAGEAGLGKTRLVTTAVAAEPDVFVAAGTCLPLSADVPLLPIGDLLRAAYDVDAGQWLEKSFGDCAAYVPGSLSRLLPELAPWAEPDPGTDGWARERLFAAVGTILKALAVHRRLGLLVEDLHWADASTLDLLEHLLCRGARVPIVGTFRLDDPATAQATEEWRVRIMRLSQVTTLELGPLSRDDTAEQLTLLLARPADRRLVDRIHRRAQGQPLFAEQLLARSGEDDQPLPRLLSDLLDQRLDRISETASAVAVALGVTGRSLGDAALRRITGLARTDLTAALRELDRARLLDSTASPGEVRLRHPLLAEAIRRRLLGGEAADVHRRVATQMAESGAPSAAEVSAHWQAAGDPEQELAWRIRAAEEAGSLHAVTQQADHWLRALELWPDAASSDAVPSLSRARVGLNAMECLRDAGQMPRALALADRAMAWLPEMSTEEAADLFYRAGYYRGETEDSVAGLDLLERSIALYGELPPCRGLVLALELKAMELAALGRRAEAAAALYRGWAVCEELGDPQMTFGLLPTIAWHEALAGDLAGALRRLERARRTAAEPGPIQELWMGVCHTDLMLIHGRPVAEVEAAGSRALEAARAWGIENAHAAIVHANLAEAMVRAGQVGRAGALVDPVTEGEVTIDRWFTHNLRALLDVLRGRVSAAAARVTALDDLQLTWHSHETARAQVAALSDVWQDHPVAALDRLLPTLAPVAASDESEFAGAAFVLAARAAADCVHGRTERPGPIRQQEVLRLLHRLRGSAVKDPFAADAVPADRRAQGATWNAELARLADTAAPEHWIAAAAEWDRLARPHDAAYCRWRGARTAQARGQADLASKLVRRAARDAREHVPLCAAIARSGTPVAVR